MSYAWDRSNLLNIAVTLLHSLYLQEKPSNTYPQLDLCGTCKLDGLVVLVSS